MKLIKQQLRAILGKHWWIWTSLVIIAGFINTGTAVLRLNSFYPVLKIQDFSSYYVGAWALRLNKPLYNWNTQFIDTLKISQNIPISPPVHNSPPIWAWIIQPFSYFSYPVAATLWLGLLILLLLWSSRKLSLLANYQSWKVTFICFLIVITFGPIMLALTLGQNSILLLVSAILIGHNITSTKKSAMIVASLAWVLAVNAKLFPIIWIALLPFLKMWRLFLTMCLTLLLIFVFISFLEPIQTATYWSDFLPNQTNNFSESADFDDQSLSGWLKRIGRTNSYTFPGLDVNARNETIWATPWQLSQKSITALTFVLFILLAGSMVFIWYKYGSLQIADGLFYGFIAFSLLPFPHMVRYNLVLLLPAMAWLWAKGVRYRQLIVMVYFLIALTRLNHLWGLILPTIVGPLVVGSGLYAILLLWGGILFFAYHTSKKLSI